MQIAARLAGLKLAVSMLDLTPLEGKDTPGKIAFLCQKPCASRSALWSTAIRAAVGVLSESRARGKNSWATPVESDVR
jgi:hypothetical protein